MMFEVKGRVLSCAAAARYPGTHPYSRFIVGAEYYRGETKSYMTTPQLMGRAVNRQTVRVTGGTAHASS